MKINTQIEKSVGGNEKDFIDFIRSKTSYINDEDIQDIDYLVQKVAKNLFLYEDNLSTAKSDYIALISLLIKDKRIFKTNAQRNTYTLIYHSRKND